MSFVPQTKTLAFAAVQAPSSELERCLEHMVKLDASDLYVTADSPPVFRVNGSGLKGNIALKASQIDGMVDALLTPAQKADLARDLELNLALTRPQGRFRVNVFRQRGATGMVVRLVRTTIKTLDEMRYPQVMKNIVLLRRGLVLLVGGTGSGKSTALAAMIDHRNSEDAGHIVTIEDPV
ncbi:MAG: ATPase, T2SS/T4P/T4SS family, partial [Polyangiaceae bacterium]